MRQCRQINSFWVSTSEQVAAQHLQLQLDGLQSHEDDFKAAISLIAHARELSGKLMDGIDRKDYEARVGVSEKAALYHRWTFMAANSAAVVIANYWDRLHAIISAARQCTSLASIIEFEKLKLAKSVFEESFPHRKGVRDGYAHKVDKSYSIEKIKKNSSPDTGHISGLITNRDVLSYSVDGEVCSLGVNDNSLQTLKTIKATVYSAFAKACEQPTLEQILRQSLTNSHSSG